MMRQSYLPLFRACCQCTYPDPALRTDEIIVFFEAEDRVRASKKTSSSVGGSMGMQRVIRRSLES